MRDLLADVPGLQRTVGFRVPEGRPQAVVAGVGSGAWDRLYTGPRPQGLHPFRPLSGAKHRAVSTPGDLLFHIRARQIDLCFEFASQVMDRLSGAVTVVDEVLRLQVFRSPRSPQDSSAEGPKTPLGAGGRGCRRSRGRKIGLHRIELCGGAEVPARPGRVEHSLR